MREGRRDAEAKTKESAKSRRSEDEGSIAMAQGLFEVFSRKFEKLKEFEKTPSRKSKADTTDEGRKTRHQSEYEGESKNT